MHLVAVLPAWMLADGDFGGLVVGGTAEFGFAVEPAHIDLGADMAGIVQVGDAVPTTTVSGTVLAPSPEAPLVIDAGWVKPIVTALDASHRGTISVRGRLVVEPQLWATDGVLWPLVPDGVRLWSVDRIRAVTAEVVDLAASPPVSAVDHDAVYLLDLNRPQPARRSVDGT
ncbi:hypothetical protein [Actinomycetospora sp. CA-084318]|uniref:hypothetical protein n=1 Tax=Actinomycetospora sp. CA-084318 TaxID=3239892 RepID=UPI003D951E5A